MVVFDEMNDVVIGTKFNSPILYRAVTGIDGMYKGTSSNVLISKAMMYVIA